MQFDFPAADAWLLRQLPGMADFDINTEILDLIKAMWGLKDAPRAFTMRLSATLRAAGYAQGVMDPQVWRKFYTPKKEVNQDEAVLGALLISMITTHIDDIKGSATDEEQEFLLKALQKDYGSDANIENTTFEHTGIQHEQDLKKGTVYTPKPLREGPERDSSGKAGDERPG